MTNHNNTQQVQLIKSRGVRVPVRLELYKHGGGIYLTIANPTEGVNVALVASAAEMAATLRRAADQIEQAVADNDQGHITRAVASPAVHGDAAAPVGPRLNPGATDWSWLTPEIIIRHFEQSPILAPMIDDVKAALKGQLGLSQPAARPLTSDPSRFGTPEGVRPPTPTSQLDLDLEAIQSHLDRITAGGKINKSEIARALGITPGGSGNWSRLVAIAEALKKAA